MNLSNVKIFIQKLVAGLRLLAGECLLPAVFLNLCVEAFSRESVIMPFFYLIKSPLVFCYNTLLILVTLSFSFFFKRRRFVRFFISALWVTVGITDFILLQFRTTPFTAVDLLLIDSAFSIMGHYLSVFQIILVLLAVLLVIGIGVFLFIRAKKETRRLSPLVAGVMVLSFLLIGTGSTNLFVSCNILERNFGNLAQGFHTNGLPYCFLTSIFRTGISRPVSYSEYEIDRIVASITSTPAPADGRPVSPETEVSPSPAPDTPDPPGNPSGQPDGTEPASSEYPNFIFLQLESFFDPTCINGAKYSSDPVPNFRRLKESCSSGFLKVPSVGAGTANTEFEILTGINLDFFGPGEYPYKTILTETTCESLAYNLSALGLKAHAIHNNDGTFYGRNTVFPKLGFHTFTPIEYMGTYETTPLGWTKDKILTKNILNALTSTEEQDFVFAISVQGHGAYPDEAVLRNPHISIDALPEELEDSYYGLLYFVNQLYEMDDFLGQLTEALEQYDEEVVLVLYGDHLPSFPFTDELLSNGSVYETEYVIWSNRPSGERIRKDMEAYALSSYVINRYDIHEGLFTRFHQTQAESETYLSDMELLAYDILYGPMESYNGELPFEATDMQFGINPIQITKVVVKNSEERRSCIFINGINFTPYSTAYVNEKKCTTTYVNPQLLSVSGFSPADTLTVSVAQVGTDSFPLSFTAPLTVTTGSEEPSDN